MLAQKKGKHFTQDTTEMDQSIIEPYSAIKYEKGFSVRYS